METSLLNNLWLWIYFGIVVTILIVVLVFCMTEFALAINYIRAKKALKSAEGTERLKEFPHVTIQLPVYNERYVAERVIRSAVAVNYPKDKLQIQVLDDSTDDTTRICAAIVAELKQDGFDISLHHRDDRNGYKAGALRDAMPAATGEFIAIFDADFLIPDHFLQDTLPYFSEPGIGMVQTRWGHLNERYSLLTRIQSFFIDMHFTVQHTGRNFFGYFINFNGTAGIWRKSCIESAGGWTPDTLTEDLDLSYRAQIIGWKFKYHEGLASPSELPAHMSGIKSQQFRWIKGGTQVGLKMAVPLARSNASLPQKWFGIMHIFSGSAYIFSFFLFLMSVPLVYMMKYTVLSETVPYMAMFMVSTFAILFSTGVSFFNVKHDVDVRMSSFLWRFTMYLCFTMGLSLNNSIAVFEGVSGRQSSFIRTPKFNLTGNSHKVTWNGMNYLSREFRPQLIAEFLLLIYFIAGIVLAIQVQFYALLMMHAMLVAGYGMVVYYSVRHSILLK